MSTIRCAIYTRKSSEEGLEQGFNTLDAQHDACAAYIASQKHEGWRPVAERFDDGGWLGGSTNRPALHRLLAEVDAGRIGMIVVYKIDRLTRSLADFARLVERLEAKGCSFVSVTQAFNTSTSMGRLTLNVLLSFAQFEREVAGERIRDKIAASKKRGLWMGGTLPLGYDRHPDPREQVLIVNEAEATTVRRIFDLYEETGCLRKLAVEVAGLDLRSKSRKGRDGREIGARLLGRGQLHYLLTNPVYRGRTRHGTAEHEGRHPPIINEAQWARVQDRLQQRSRRVRGTDRLDGEAAPLVGKLVDDSGDRLTPTHTQKGSRRYRYYVSHRLVTGTADASAWRLPATALESGIAAAISVHLRRVVFEHRLLTEPDMAAQPAIEARLAELLGTTENAKAYAVLALVDQGRLERDQVSLVLSHTATAAALGVAPEAIAGETLVLSCPLSLQRRGTGSRVVIGARATQPDAALVQALGRANQWLRAIRAGRDIRSLAHVAGLSEGCLRVHLQLAFLAPPIQAAILDGTQPAGLSVHRLTRPEMRADWAAQHARAGLPRA